MSRFQHLRAVAEHRRHCLPFVTTLVDYDLLVEIGYWERRGEPIMHKGLLHIQPWKRTTLRRRLAHLRKRGVVLSKRGRDGRSVVFTLDRSVSTAFAKWDRAVVSTMHAEG